MALIYEMHIAVPVTTKEKMDQVMADLRSIGIQKTKYFHQVHNIITERQDCNVPPTGHDLDNPGAMATVKTATREEAVTHILNGMRVLKDHGLHGNFELEGILAPSIEDYEVLPVSEEFPGYSNVPDSPAYENHMVWKAPLSELPDFEEITKLIRENYDLQVHQIVDFCRVQYPTAEDVVSRVATIYQPSREGALKAGKLLQNRKNTGSAYAVTEQVMAVGH